MAAFSEQYARGRSAGKPIIPVYYPLGPFSDFFCLLNPVAVLVAFRCDSSGPLYFISQANLLSFNPASQGLLGTRATAEYGKVNNHVPQSEKKVHKHNPFVILLFHKCMDIGYCMHMKHSGRVTCSLTGSGMFFMPP